MKRWPYIGRACPAALATGEMRTNRGAAFAQAATAGIVLGAIVAAGLALRWKCTAPAVKAEVATAVGLAALSALGTLAAGAYFGWLR